MHLNELVETLEGEVECAWIDPAVIKGINKEETFLANRKKWFRSISEYTGSYDFETQDEIITDYLCDCISARNVTLKYKEKIPAHLKIDGYKLVKALIFLIFELGSSYASTNLSAYRDLINDDNASESFDSLVDAYERSDSFIKDILRDLILSLYCYGPMWQNNKGDFFNVFNQHQNAKLKEIYKNGYSTKYPDWVAEPDYS